MLNWTQKFDTKTLYYSLNCIDYEQSYDHPDDANFDT